MPSDRFTQLQTQLNVLRGHLLPTPFDPTGTYDDQEKVATAALAYRVLSHAEIESYFEDRVMQAVDHARVAWENTMQVSRIILCLLAFSGKEMRSPPDTLEAPNENKKKTWPEQVDIAKRLSPLIANFSYYVRKENHGIKEKNLLSLLLPIGVNHSRLDPTFLADMDSFGALRGATAHSSRSTSVRQAVDPAEEWKRIEALMSGIESVDTLIDSLIQDIPRA
ncbi:hypothetical protein B0F87_106102 [Methylobacter tundripaludum]|uniref:RiboL-PSP-HEPN domain-containing protein n=1 Tax=Methylobacter tundripaludum TaxID=173365 RepID=A0A2S6HCP8_9GAMM|nr:hypothetical protein [Methylobacter tundripaludum]PPK75255.1 hypothetical protein B0F87_106102 [Methylobacter tundripaludum]